MNLVQIQEHLKGMPIQALMSYANGMNPSVPPYLALGELNRRKQAEQMAQKPEPQQGTVKDRIEGEAGLMALKKQAMDQMRLGALRQQQMAQGQAAQSAMQPQAVPAGVPEPEMQEEVTMADGGIATIRVPDNVMEFGSGGIVAFSEGGDKGKKKAEEPTQEEIDAARRPYIGTSSPTSKKVEQETGPTIWEKIANYPIMDTLIPAYAVDKPVAQSKTDAAVAEAPAPAPAPAPVVRPAPPRAPGITGTTVAQAAQPTPVAQPAQPAGPNYLEMLAKQASGEGQKSYADKLADAAKVDPYLNKQPGEMMEQYLQRMAERQSKEEERAKELDKERLRSGIWRSLIAAGEASRGQRGIGALMGGFGRVAGEELEASRGREEAQMKARREFEDNMAKMRQEIENARISRAQGRFDEANKHDQKAQEFKAKAIEKGADIQSTRERDTEKYAQDERMAKLRFEYEKKLKGIPQAQRATLEEQFVQELVNAGKPRADAIREAKTLGTGAEKQDLAELKALQKTYQDQADPTKNFDAASRADAAKRLAVVNNKIEQMAGLGGGPKEGDKATSNSGKPIIYRNGRWEYV